MKNTEIALLVLYSLITTSMGAVATTILLVGLAACIGFVRLLIELALLLAGKEKEEKNAES